MDFENTRLRAACITTYQVDQIDSMDWDRILKTTPVTYVIAGKEVCPETGKIHYQMYMEFDRKVTVRQIKRILRDPAAHIEPRYGTADEAKLYCKKDGLWWEKGRSKIQGERNDLKDVYEGLKVGKSLLEIIEDHPGTFIRYFKGIERTLDIIRRDQQRREERISPTVIVYIGKSGTGKSHRCYNDPDYQASGYKYPCQQTGKVYFDGYDGESVIWFDEFGGSVLPFGVFLRVCDKWETRVETKGGSVCITGLKKILISTTTYPKDWWAESRKYHEDPNQLWRRLTKVYYIPKISVGYANPQLITYPESFNSELADKIDRETEAMYQRAREEHDAFNRMFRRDEHRESRVQSQQSDSISQESGTFGLDLSDTSSTR